MKNIWHDIKEKMGSVLSSNKLQKAFKKANTSHKASRGSGSLLQKMITMNKPPIEKYYPAIISIFVAYTAADLTTTYMRAHTIPSSIQSKKIAKQDRSNYSQRLRSEFDPIASRNIFNSDGVIPNPISGGGENSEDIDGPAVATNLPLKLVGTIVHVNPAKSVATIEVNQGGAKIIPYIPNDEIEGLAILLKVERKKIILRNKKSRRLEFLEMPEDLKLSFKLGVTKPSAADSSPNEIQNDGNNFTISRATIDKHIKNIGEVLQQARAVPNRDPVTGEINGFRLLYIKPNSIFTELGLKPGDLLQEINGSKITSIQKAMEMYQNLKNSNSITLTKELNGKTETSNYTIN